MVQSKSKYILLVHAKKLHGNCHAMLFHKVCIPQKLNFMLKLRWHDVGPSSTPQSKSSIPFPSRLQSSIQKCAFHSISFFSFYALPRIVTQRFSVYQEKHCTCFEKRCRGIIKTNLDAQFRYCIARSTSGQTFALQQDIKKFWHYQIANLQKH